MSKNQEVAEELNLLIQDYLLGKFGAETEFTAQFNDDYIHLWVKYPDEKAGKDE